MDYLDKIVLFGAGEYCGRLMKRIGEKIVAIIDSDDKKCGSSIEDIPIISYEEYKNSYSMYYILVTPINNTSIIEQLKKDNNYKYFLAVDLPGEWLDVNSRIEYFSYIKNCVKSNKKWAIFGCNFHAFLLYRYVREMTGINGIMVADENSEIAQIISYKKDFRIEIINREDLKKYDVEVIYIAARLEEDDDFDCERVETWDCSYLISNYYNPGIKKYRNKHKKQRCFIIGNGPSLRIEDLDILYHNEEICMGVNSIYELYPRTKWRPDYYFSEDTRFVDNKEYLPAIKDMSIYKGVFIGDRGEAEIDEKKVEVVHVQTIINKSKPAKFSHDLTKVAYFSSTVLYFCIQMAVYMGFSEIYLLGVDFTGGKNGTWTKYKNFHGVYDGGVLANQIVYQGYLAAKREEEKGDFRIYNATRGGELELFERVPFDSL